MLGLIKKLFGSKDTAPVPTVETSVPYKVEVAPVEVEIKPVVEVAPVVAVDLTSVPVVAQKKKPAGRKPAGPKPTQKQPVPKQSAPKKGGRKPRSKPAA
jgi:hypothetical protein